METITITMPKYTIFIDLIDERFSLDKPINVSSCENGFDINHEEVKKELPGQFSSNQTFQVKK